MVNRALIASVKQDKLEAGVTVRIDSTVTNSPPQTGDGDGSFANIYDMKAEKFRT